MGNGNACHAIRCMDFFIYSYAACGCMAASFFWGHGFAADAMPPLPSKLELILPTSEAWQARSTHLVLIQW